MKSSMLRIILLGLLAVCYAAEATVIQGETSPGVYTNVAVDSSGKLSIAATALPSGAATSAKQDTGNTSLSTISGQLPTTLGAKTGATSISVVPNTDTTFPVSGTLTGVTTVATVTTITNAVPVKASTGTITNRSGTITSGGTAQTIMAANSTRLYLFIQNTSDTIMWCNFTTTAVATQPSFSLIPGASFVMEGTAVSTEAVSCIGATTGKIFTAKEM